MVHRINVCGVDILLGYFTINELDRLDKYASGGLHISDDELEHLGSVVEDRVGGEEVLYKKMEQKCPDVFRDAEDYRKTNP